MPAEPDWIGMKKRLEVIIMLLLEGGANPATSTTSKIERLLEFGLTNSEVAEIIGKKLNYVTAVVSGKRKAQKPKEQGVV